MPSTVPNHKRVVFWGSVCFVVLSVIITAGLWPFDFNPENKAAWLIDRNGIRFYGRAAIYHRDLIGPHDGTLKDGSITVELWLQPAYKPDRYLPCILSFYDGNESEGFSISQWKSSLVLRSRSGHSNYRERGVDPILSVDEEHFITIVSGLKSTLVYHNGTLSGSYPGFTLLSDRVRLPGRFILGNSPGGKNYWKGKIFGLAFYNGPLTAAQAAQSYLSWKLYGITSLSEKDGLFACYPFREQSGTVVHNSLGNYYQLMKPDRFKPVQETILKLPWEDNSPLPLSDFLINLAGFVPFGFCFFAFFSAFSHRNKKTLLTATVLLGFVISLGIELTQAFLPGRDSSLHDVLLNTAGTFLGTLSAFYMTRRLPGGEGIVP